MSIGNLINNLLNIVSPSFFVVVPWTAIYLDGFIFQPEVLGLVWFTKLLHK